MPEVGACPVGVRQLNAAALLAPLACLAIAGCSDPAPAVEEPAMRWLAGDNHVHSRYSVLWDQESDPPEPRIGAHGVYPIALNALMARHYGLTWMVTTDHGGRWHSKLYLDEAYPNLQVAREVVPEVIHYYGLEMNPPGGDHASVIFPHTHDEAQRLYEFESTYDRRQCRPVGPRQRHRGADAGSPANAGFTSGKAARHRQPSFQNRNGRRALRPIYTRGVPRLERHGARRGDRHGGITGHQAISILRDGSLREGGTRGQYSGIRTRGGFDPMTSILGGLWDSLLGEGRRWWITANSDSHRHWSDGGVDFWPGEYSKTYVYSRKTAPISWKHSDQAAYSSQPAALYPNST